MGKKSQATLFANPLINDISCFHSKTFSDEEKFPTSKGSDYTDSPPPGEEGEKVLPVIDFTGRFRLKGVPSSGGRYIKG